MCPDRAPRAFWSFVALSRTLGDAFDRDHSLALFHAEQSYTLGGTPLNADTAHRQADRLPLIGDQHQMIGFLHREAGNKSAVASLERHGGDALSSSSHGTIFIGTRALAVTLFADRQHKLLAGAQLGIALRRQ